MAKTIDYHCRVLGRLWMPQTLAAVERSYGFEGVIPQSLADEIPSVEKRLYADKGDFSLIEDYEIVRVVREVEYSEPSINADGHSVVYRSESVEETTIRPWGNEGSEDDFFDCMGFSETAEA